jgi:carboxylesterase
LSPAVRDRLHAWHRDEDADGVPVAHRSFRRSADACRGHVLLLHGAGGSPADFHALASDLQRSGLSSLCPLLPAHGRGDAAVTRAGFEELAVRALEAFDALAASGGRPAVVGQSLGAVLAIRVATQRAPARFAALAPALRPFVLRRLLALLPAFAIRPRRAAATLRWQAELRRGILASAARIPEVRCPLLVLHSRDDPSVSVRGARELTGRASSAERRLIVLERQGHVLSIAPDREAVFGPLREFLGRATGEGRSGTTDPPP